MKKLTSICLAAMIIALAAVTTSCKTNEPTDETIDPNAKYDLYVGDVQVTGKNATDIKGEGLHGKISYNPKTKTLTLDNAMISSSKLYAGGTVRFYGIQNEKEDLTVNLVGNNTIDIYNDDSNIDLYDDSDGYGIYSDEKLTITGSGKLHIKQVDCSAAGGQNYHYGLAGLGVVIDKASVTIESKGMAGSIDPRGGNLHVTDGATLICNRYIGLMDKHPTIYSGAVLEEGNSKGTKKKVDKLTLKQHTSGKFYTSYNFIAVSPAGIE